MRKSKKLIISNSALSNTESNGRIISLLFVNYIGSVIYNYCLGGVPDKNDIYYVNMNDKRNIESLLTFGLIKPDMFCPAFSSNRVSFSGAVKSRKAIHYYIRNILYMINFHITKYMVKYIKNNDIESIFLFGADSPFLYRLSRILSKKCNIPLEIYTCEDYPLKDYNYIEGGKHNKNIFFKLLMKSLKKQARKAYWIASKSTFNSELLCEDYKKAIKVSSPSVRYLPSILDRVDYKVRDIKHIVYGGNLNSGRVSSVIDVLNTLKELESDVVLHLYGKIDKRDLETVNKYSNAKYEGLIPYIDLVSVLKNADMLLHVEGFSEYHLKDYRHAFSTKISDYYMLGIPFLMYSDKTIASTQYGLVICPDYVCTNKIELKEKLKNILSGKTPYNVDYEKIKNDFSPFC